MKVKDLLDLLWSLMAEPCVKSEREIKDNGLNFGNPEEEVKAIAVAWKPTIDVIEKAHELGANILIVHEALLYDYSPHIVGDNYVLAIKANRERVERLVKYGINVIRFHTPWDDAKDGNNDTLLKLFGLKLVEKYPCVRVGELEKPMKAKELALLVKEKLKAPNVIFVGDENKLVKRVTVIAGAGAKGVNFVDFAIERSDALISGDSTADTRDLAYESGFILIDPGHQYLEQAGMESLANKLKELVKVPVYFIRNADYLKIL